MSFLEILDTDLTKVRVGKESDGGYVVAHEVCQTIDTLYTFGVADDVSFELDFVERYPNCNRVYLFDPTVDGLPENHRKFTFFKEGIGRDYLTLPEAIQKIGPHIASRPMLKMDVEWSEWDVLEQVPMSILGQFRQIVCELHFVPTNPAVQEGFTPYFAQFHSNAYRGITRRMFRWYCEVIHKLTRAHAIIHIHGNNSLGLWEYEGMKIPHLLEVTLVRNTEFNEANTYTGSLPIAGLDFPNKPWKPELEGWYPI